MQRRSPHAILIAALLLSPAARAQDIPAPPPDAAGPPQPAAVGGAVLSARDGKPLNRATVVLKPADTHLTARSDTTDDKGRFLFAGVSPGRYSLEVARDGFLTANAAWFSDYHFPPVFTVRSGQDLTGLTFKLYPWCILAGRISFNDAEPSVGAEVTLYRDTWWRGRHVYAVAGRAVTDDRGEYRIHGLDPGSYLVSASWNKPVLVAGAREEPRRDEQGRALPDEAYAVTFYPDAQRLLDAVPLHLGYGEEANGVDIFLSTARSIRIHGHVTSGIGGGPVESPTITLRRTGADNTASITVPASIDTMKNGDFQISGVVPGSYYVVAEADVNGNRLMARRLVTTGDENIANIELLAAPVERWHGSISFVDGPAGQRPDSLTVALDPRDETATPIDAPVREDGTFSFEFVPDAVYDIYVKNLPAGAYLKAAFSGTADLLASGVSAAPGAAPPPVHILVSFNAASITGAVMNPDRSVAPGVNVDLIPDPPAGRYQDFVSTNADEYGSVRVSGIAPGRYVVIAWAGDAPCDIYDPNEINTCRAAGSTVTLPAGAATSVSLLLANP